MGSFGTDWLLLLLLSHQQVVWASSNHRLADVTPLPALSGLEKRPQGFRSIQVIEFGLIKSNTPWKRWIFFIFFFLNTYTFFYFFVRLFRAVLTLHGEHWEKEAPLEVPPCLHLSVLSSGPAWLGGKSPNAINGDHLVICSSGTINGHPSPSRINGRLRSGRVTVRKVHVYFTKCWGCWDFGWNSWKMSPYLMLRSMLE